MVQKETPGLGLDFAPTTIDAFRRRREAPNSQLTPEFATRVFEVTSQMDPETLVASLIVYSEPKRETVLTTLESMAKRSRRGLDKALARREAEEVMRAELNARELEARMAYIRTLPKSPDNWQRFIKDIRVPQKKVLMQALGRTLSGGGKFHSWKGLESGIVVQDLRQIEISPEFTPDSQVPMSDVFLSLAFRGSPQT